MSSTISELLKSGLEHHQAGRLQEAEAIYQSILKQQPRQADALHLLGVMALQIGKNDVAVNLIENAISIKPDEADFYNNCGEAYRALQKHDLAIDRYRQALALRPAFAGAHNNLGNAFKELGQLDEAINCYQQAIDSSPDFFMAHNNLGIALKDSGRIKDAIPHYEQALAIMPDYAEAHNNLGNALQQLGQAEDAITHYEKAITIIPAYAEAHSNLGNALKELDRQEEAIACYEQALAIKPDFAMAHYNLGIALDELNRPQQAIGHYEQAIAIKPDYAEAHNNLGFALQELGQRHDAIRHYETAIAIKPDYAASHLHLSMLNPKPEQITVIKQLLTNPAITATDATHYHFALGNIYNNAERFDEAFEHFHTGNDLHRSGVSYNAQDYSAYVDKLIATYTRSYFQKVSAYGADSDLPVFIIGMPRSGTTLVEQIISSHPQVYGAGELAIISGIEKHIASHIGTSSPYPECMSLCSDAIVDKYSAECLEKLRVYSDDANRITDKDPGNFHRLGLIKTLFPKARIIHCQRNALDTCVSIFFNYFGEGNEYACKLQELGQYYLDYQRLMAHWCSLFAAEIMTVQYEELVMNQKVISQQLIEHIGLEWDDTCLDFHLNKRAVRTASSGQVRQPLYTHSIDRWRHYEKQLLPLTEILRGNAFENP